MPEIDIIHVYEWPGSTFLGETSKRSFSAEKPDGSTVHTDDEDFGVGDLVEIGAAHGVTRWAERGDTLPDLNDEVILVGWAEAPISRDDVEQHSDRGSGGAHPAINIKVYNTELPKGDAFKEVVDEHELDSRLATLSLDDLRSMVEKYLENDVENHTFNWVCERGFEDAKEDAVCNCFPSYSIQVYAEGRSGGWLVVYGLPDIDSWDAKLLTAWHQFQQFCKGQVADIPRAMVWEVLANHQDDLAGRLVRVEVSMVLADADLEAGDPATEWDWRDMLDLDSESTINVRKL